MPRQLENLQITRVALCSKGMNPEAQIELFKMEDGMANKPKTPEELQKELDDLQAQLKAEGDARKAAEDAAAQAADKLAKAEEKVEKGELVSKADFEALQKQATETAEILKAREEQIEKAEIQAIAKAMSQIGSGDEFEADLRTVRKALGDNWGRFQQRLQAAHAVIKDSVLFHEIGSDGEGDNTPDAQLAKMARDKAAKDGMTYEKAYASVLKSPDGQKLYEQFARKGA